MAIVKEKYGLVCSEFHPIASMPANSHPVYAEPIDMGAAVKAYLTINYAEAQLYGDDVLQLDLREFTGGQLDAETLLSDLEIESKIHGSTMNAGVLTDNVNDSANEGGYSYIQKLKTALGTVFRAVFLYRVRPRMTADNSDTKGSGITFANNAITYGVMSDNVGDWRARQDFTTEAAARAFLRNLPKSVSGGAFAVRLTIVGSGESPQKGTTFVQSGGSLAVNFTAPPSKLYDGTEDVTTQLADNTYTISNIASDHILTAIF